MMTNAGPGSLTSSWWVLMVRGIVTVLFGLLVFVYPLSAAAAFVILFGAFVLVNGVFALIAAVQWHHPESPRWWYTIAQAVIGIAIGIVTFIDPSITGFALGVLIAIWAIATGVAEIATGVRMRRQLPGEIFLIIAGVASILLGIAFLASPLLPILFLTIAIAIYAIVAGVSLIIIASRLRGLHGGSARP